MRLTSSPSTRDVDLSRVALPIEALCLVLGLASAACNGGEIGPAQSGDAGPTLRAETGPGTDDAALDAARESDSVTGVPWDATVADGSPGGDARPPGDARDDETSVDDGPFDPVETSVDGGGDASATRADAAEGAVEGDGGDGSASGTGAHVEGGCPIGLRSATQISAGGGPTAPVLADLDGDGKLDLLLANGADAKIAVYLGDGHGGFASPVLYATGLSPRSIAVGDINGDGVPDMAVANGAAGQPVTVMLGDGHGAFVAQPPVMAGAVPMSVAMGDANGDGRLDLFVANAGSDDVGVLFGDGTGSFLAQQAWGLIIDPDALVVGDLDGDGRLDLMVGASALGSVSVLPGSPGGLFPTQVTASFGYLGPASLALGDVDGDGRLDLALANPSTYDVTVARGAGNGNFLPRVSVPLNAAPVSVALGDIDGDGALDLAVGTSVTEAQSNAALAMVLLGQHDGTFQAPVAFGVGTSPGAVALGDLDGDGRADLVVANAGADTVSVLGFSPCAGTPGSPATSLCVQGAACAGTTELICSGGVAFDSCTQICTCSTSGLYCELGCP